MRSPFAHPALYRRHLGGLGNGERLRLMSGRLTPSVPCFSSLHRIIRRKIVSVKGWKKENAPRVGALSQAKTRLRRSLLFLVFFFLSAASATHRTPPEKVPGGPSPPPLPYSIVPAVCQRFRGVTPSGSYNAAILLPFPAVQPEGLLRAGLSGRTTPGWRCGVATQQPRLSAHLCQCN